MSTPLVTTTSPPESISRWSHVRILPEPDRALPIGGRTQFKYHAVQLEANTVHIVYSNYPGQLRSVTHLLFPPDATVVWFPENELNEKQLQLLATGATPVRGNILVTNSLWFIRAMQRHKDAFPKRLQFCYVDWIASNSMVPIDYWVHKTYDLDAALDKSNGLKCTPPHVQWEQNEYNALMDAARQFEHQ